MTERKSDSCNEWTVNFSRFISAKRMQVTRLPDLFSSMRSKESHRNHLLLHRQQLYVYFPTKWAQTIKAKLEENGGVDLACHIRKDVVTGLASQTLTLPSCVCYESKILFSLAHTTNNFELYRMERKDAPFKSPYNISAGEILEMRGHWAV